jgi:hypothetical protein
MKVGHRGASRRSLRHHQHELYDPIRIRIAERLEQYGIDYGKDGCICADAQSESQYSGYGEAARPAELTKSIANVLRSLGKPLIRAFLAMQLLRLFHAAISTPGCKTGFAGRQAFVLKFILEQRKMSRDFPF